MNHEGHIEEILRKSLQAEKIEDTLLAEILLALLDIRGILKTPQGIAINQGGSMITGITAGGAPGVFGGTPVPVGSVFPAGTTFTWTSDVPSVTLTPSADGTQVSAVAAQTETATQFTLTDTSSFNGVAGSVVVPILPFVPQVPTSISIDQIS